VAITACKSVAICWALAALASGGPAQAARPLITDDARIVDAGACQVESWLKHGEGLRETWALPGCNFTGNLELTAGGGRVRSGGSGLTTWQVQGKTLFRTLDQPGAWAWGLALGATRTQGGGKTDPYFYLPITTTLQADKLFLHINLGARRETAVKHTQTTWGLGLESLLSEHWGAIAESFKQDSGRPLYQLGARYWVVPERVQIDATVGNRFGGGAPASAASQRWFSLGLRVLTPKFMN
jgi:hypothetical protein